jgi:hypothetical protein
VGTCGRCGNYLCEVCRTRWRGQVVCAACVDRALESREAAPEEARAHLRQAVLGLALGGAAWGLFLLFFLLGAAAGASGQPSAALAFLVLIVLLGTLLSAALGLGQAAAALRTRGSHMILATAGLLVSGLCIGVVIGLFTFGLWQS